MNTTCDCGRGSYDDEHYSSCYECFLDRRSEYSDCIFCGSWHSPAFNTCFKCRAISPAREEAARDLKLVILTRDHWRCCYCDADDKPLQIDHVKPCAAGGTPDPWNLQALCADCNRNKGRTWYETGFHAQRSAALVEAYATYLYPYLSPDERERLHLEVDQMLELRVDKTGRQELRPLTQHQAAILTAWEAT